MLSYTFDSGVPGKNLLVIGSIHGDEIAGSQGIELFREKVISGEIRIQSGKVTCIPYANHKAYLEKTRYIEHNANRIFQSHGNTEEHKRVEQIKGEIRKVDFVLDLHTYHIGKGSFAFDDFNTPEIKELLSYLPVDTILVGWNHLYTETLDLDTIGYAIKQGKLGITVECGYHTDETAPSIALQSIISISKGLNILPGTPDIHSGKRIKIESVIKKSEGGIFSQKWEHGDTIAPNESIYSLNGVNHQNISESRIMIIPHHEAKTGDEWFYVGTAET